MSWPNQTDYYEAIQNPQTCFRDDKCRRGKPSEGPTACLYSVFRQLRRRLPVPRAATARCGPSSASPARSRACKNAIQDQRVSRSKAKLPFTVGFNYLDEASAFAASGFPS